MYLLALWNMFSGYEYLRVEKTKIPWLIERLAHDRAQVGPAPSRTVFCAKYANMSGNTPAKLSRENANCQGVHRSTLKPSSWRPSRQMKAHLLSVKRVICAVS